MRTLLTAANITVAIAIVRPSAPSKALQIGRALTAQESRIPVGKSSLYARETGRGQAIIVLHGGPDFDHSYLLPDLDRLAAAFRLLYYDQRGRGKSADQVLPEEVTLRSDLDDIDRVRQHFHLETMALLGHSWGAVLALEYAIRAIPTRCHTSS